MSVFLIYAFVFFAGSIMGWLIELVFRRFFTENRKKKKWVNPGFLNGPYLPLYGFGLCGMFVMAGLENTLLINNPVLQKVVLFAIMAVMMTIIEYIAGIIFIKQMKVKLWDYSAEKWNIQGIICPKFSFFWAVLSAVYYFLIHPYVLNGIKWLSDNLAFCFLVGFFYGVFVIDVCISFNVLVKIRKFAHDNDIIVKYERLKEEIRNNLEERNQRGHFLLAFHTDRRLFDSLQEHMINLRGKKR